MTADELHIYYTLARPPAPGAVPGTPTTTGEFIERKYIESIGRMAWGFAIYDKALTQKQIDDYELMEEIKSGSKDSKTGIGERKES